MHKLPCLAVLLSIWKGNFASTATVLGEKTWTVAVHKTHLLESLWLLKICKSLRHIIAVFAAVTDHPIKFELLKLGYRPNPRKTYAKNNDNKQHWDYELICSLPFWHAEIFPQNGFWIDWGLKLNWVVKYFEVIAAHNLVPCLNVSECHIGVDYLWLPIFILDLVVLFLKFGHLSVKLPHLALVLMSILLISDNLIS